jgi:secreted trypsin-like serine protease
MSHKLLAVVITAALSLSAQAKQIETKGSEFRPLIVGGVVAEKGEFPFQVSLQT